MLLFYVKKYWGCYSNPNNSTSYSLAFARYFVLLKSSVVYLMIVAPEFFYTLHKMFELATSLFILSSFILIYFLLFILS